MRIPIILGDFILCLFFWEMSLPAAVCLLSAGDITHMLPQERKDTWRRKMAYYYVQLCGYPKILQYFATFGVIVILLKSVAQNCLRLQWTSGSLLTDVSILWKTTLAQTPWSPDSPCFHYSISHKKAYQVGGISTFWQKGIEKGGWVSKFWICQFLDWLLSCFFFCLSFSLFKLRIKLCICSKLPLKSSKD